MPTSQTTALVTGASSGIGAAIALALARCGYDVAVSAREIETLGDTIAGIRATGRRALPIALDLRSQASIEQAISAAIDAFGKLDVLVNNAGAPFIRIHATEITSEQWDTVMSINVTGTFFMSQLMARHLMKNQRSGCILNIASTHGLVGSPEVAAYGVSKSAIIHMTKMLAIEWAAFGITVNAIAPGAVETPSRPGLRDPKRREMLLSRIPLRRFCTAEQVASAVCYLASQEANYITGHTLVLDGGFTSV